MNAQSQPALSAINPAFWLNYPILQLGDKTLTMLVVLKIVFWIVGVLAANALLRRYLLRRLLDQTKFDNGLKFAVTKMFGYAFVTLGFYVALVVNGFDLSSLAVGAGALGIGIGFGLQSIVANFVSGLVLLAERPVSIGDRREFAGVAGNVTKISLRSTVVVTNDNISIIVPNSDLTSHPITNRSHGDLRVRMRLPIGVASGSDIDKVGTTLLEIAAGDEEVLKSPKAEVYFEGFGDNALNSELAVWTESMSRSPGVSAAISTTRLSVNCAKPKSRYTFRKESFICARLHRRPKSLSLTPTA